MTELSRDQLGAKAGPVFFQDGDYFGRTVNVAARIAAYASAGEVLVSDAVLRAPDPPGCCFESSAPPT
jgi:class 3 adenylate cyclase